MTKKISICGCGWLGLPLAQSLVSQGFIVNGSKRLLIDAEALSNKGINGVDISLPFPELLSIEQAFKLNSFFQSDVLVVNVPPGRKPGSDEAFKQKVQSLSNTAKTLINNSTCRLSAQNHTHNLKVIFISTTSVYSDYEGEVTETSPPLANTASGHAHVWLESWLREQWQDNLVVLRLSGLIGKDRHPVKHIVKRFESTQQPLENGLTPVNLIHQKDVIAAIMAIINHWPKRKVFHLAAATHPTRSEYYREMAKRLNLPLPEFVDNGKTQKLINASQSIAELGLILEHPDLMKLNPFE